MATEAPSVKSDSTVQFHPLFFRSPKHASDDWIIGHELNSTAIALPEQGVTAIRELQAGKSVAASGAVVHQQYGQEIDVVDLVQVLAGLGLVESIDSRTLEKPETIGQRWLGTIPTAYVAWLYSRPALLLYGLIILAGPLIFLSDAASRPQAQNILWNSSYTVDVLTLLLLSPIMLFKHELGHLLAARAQGLAAELTFGHRLFYLVAVSRIAGIWKVTRWKRLLIYSAGMINDCVVAGASALVLLMADTHLFILPTAIRGLLGLVIISEYLGVAWEFQIFLKTDIYHIVADLTDQHDLPERARALLYALWKRFAARFRFENTGLGLPTVTYDWITVSYTLLLVIGIGGSFFWLFFYLLPATVSAIHGELMLTVIGLSAGKTKDTLAILDGCVALAFQLLTFALLGWSFWKAYRSRKRQPQSFT